jgi:hypothetical protein
LGETGFDRLITPSVIKIAFLVLSGVAVIAGFIMLGPGIDYEEGLLIAGGLAVVLVALMLRVSPERT